jgi:hypothetical protein
VEDSRKPVVGIDRRQNPDIVSALPKLARELFDVRQYTAGVGV